MTRSLLDSLLPLLMTPTIASRGLRFVDMNTVSALKIIHSCNNLDSDI